MYVEALRKYQGLYVAVWAIRRAVARSENPGGLVVLGGDNVPHLVEIGLTDLPKTGGHVPPWSPRLQQPCYLLSRVF